jgi:hypothetical protein
MEGSSIYRVGINIIAANTSGEIKVAIRKLRDLKCRTNSHQVITKNCFTNESL